MPNATAEFNEALYQAQTDMLKAGSDKQHMEDLVAASSFMADVAWRRMSTEEQEAWIKKAKEGGR